MIISEAVRECRRHLGGDKAQRNVVNGEALAADTTVVLTYEMNLSLGSILETASGELLYVWAYDSGTKTATVERGYDGTTAATIANGSVVRLNPRFPQTEILAAIQHEIRSLSSEGMYQRKTATVTYDSTEDKFDLSAVTDMLSPYALSYDPTSGRTQYVFEFVERDGFIRPLYEPDATTATLHYRAPFVEFATTADDLESVCKIPEAAHDIIPLGAAARLILGKEGLRVDVVAQTVGRKPEDVPPASAARFGQLLRMERDRRIAHEVRRLREVWPARMA